MFSFWFFICLICCSLVFYCFFISFYLLLFVFLCFFIVLTVCYLANKHIILGLLGVLLYTSVYNGLLEGMAGQEGQEDECVEGDCEGMKPEEEEVGKEGMKPPGEDLEEEGMVGREGNDDDDCRCHGNTKR